MITFRFGMHKGKIILGKLFMVPYFTKTGFQKYARKEKMNPAGTPRKMYLWYI